MRNLHLRKQTFSQAQQASGTHHSNGAWPPLTKNFFETEPYKAFNRRLNAVMEARDKRLKIGLLEQKGGALIAPSGVGKSRMIDKAIADFHRVAEATGGREFGHQIVSVIVPGRATPKETAAEILRTLGYSVKNARDEDYFSIGSRIF